MADVMYGDGYGDGEGDGEGYSHGSGSGDGEGYGHGSGSGYCILAVVKSCATISCKF